MLSNFAPHVPKSRIIITAVCAVLLAILLMNMFAGIVNGYAGESSDAVLFTMKVVFGAASVIVPLALAVVDLMVMNFVLEPPVRVTSGGSPE